MDGLGFKRPTSKQWFPQKTCQAVYDSRSLTCSVSDKLQTHAGLACRKMKNYHCFGRHFYLCLASIVALQRCRRIIYISPRQKYSLCRRAWEPIDLCRRNKRSLMRLRLMSKHWGVIQGCENTELNHRLSL
ncbi:hypothetical protein JTE90_004204 [Oedothorax gibbosus]|uniref:Uncharacterized protein n=1 Tax=Oedothorax gibbosus TaxID=931172 RepID=A0AAV6V371_9ARAC|nr:hypothetical protein JTE90_004204 [Oedothorax gibbosus]